jgi:hypothetical protein
MFYQQNMNIGINPCLVGFKGSFFAPGVYCGLVVGCGLGGFEGNRCVAVLRSSDGSARKLRIDFIHDLDTICLRY